MNTEIAKKTKALKKRFVEELGKHWRIKFDKKAEEMSFDEIFRKIPLSEAAITYLLQCSFISPGEFTLQEKDELRKTKYPLALKAAYRLETTNLAAATEIPTVKYLEDGSTIGYVLHRNVLQVPFLDLFIIDPEGAEQYPDDILFCDASNAIFADIHLAKKLPEYFKS